MRFAIIDTGLKGACVIFEEVDGVPNPVDYYLFKSWDDGIDCVDFAAHIKIWNVRHFFIEKPAAMPNQSSTNTWKQAYSVAQTTCSILLSVENAVIHDFYPITWVSHARRHLKPLERHLESKKAMQSLAPRMFPKFMAKFKKRTLYHDGIADCIGMLFYVKRSYYSQFIEDDD